MTPSIDPPVPQLPRAWSWARSAIATRGRRGPLAPHDRWPGLARLDREVAARTDAVDLGPAADAALRRLSGLANRSVLWAVAGAALAVTGPTGRRAAVRGAATLLAASAVANLVAKPLLGGERPAASGLDALRRLTGQPTSGSFPSGHSASAAAFTLGVATEWPAAGAVLAPVAAAVAYSRLHVGAHWFSDVLGGVAIGAGAAAVGRIVAPRETRRRPPPAPAPAVDLPALPDGEGLFVVVNPASGPDDTDAAAAVRSALPAARVHELSEDDDVARLVADAVAGGARAVGVSGGDGTVGSVAAGARAHDVPLVVFPGGTLNHFAKALHLDGRDVDDPVALVADAVRSGTGVAVDVGELEVRPADGEVVRRTVLNTFALGAYPELVARRERLEARLGKWAAAVVAAVRTLPGAEPLPVGGPSGERDVWSLFAGIDRYAPRGPAPVERTRLDDGILDVRSALAERRPSRTRVLARTVLDGVGSGLAARVPRTRSWLATAADEVETLELVVTAGTTLAHDGETLVVGDPASSAGPVRLRLTLKPAALRVYAPADGTAPTRANDGTAARAAELRQA
ncbi:bifunctional phosphatase PAP2/diacylglycerol kinase family protein [Luteimicrobium sp. DT211]|uniref:bifunctional phosphatase PAP2/diacylglycerol kinase family protein n=1 Tax=Luteimicrobium sp. DT211 TaxID=3393412 RepID=UPI003CFA27C6